MTSVSAIVVGTAGKGGERGVCVGVGVAGVRVKVSVGFLVVEEEVLARGDSYFLGSKVEDVALG